MPAVGKRKRDEYEASDDEDGYVLGKQVLPVADLPFNFDGVPEDGAQYLFTVRYVRILRLRQHIVLVVLISSMSCRRDASLLPHSKRVDNPYAMPEAPADVAPGPSTNHTSRKPAVPSEEWRGVVKERFRNLKRVRVPREIPQRSSDSQQHQNMDQPTINVRVPLPSNTIPEMRNRAGWWVFIAGAPELMWNPPKKPKARKYKKKFGKGMRGFADEDLDGGFEDAEAEAFLPTPHGTPSPSDHPSEDGSRNRREPTPTMLRLIDEVQHPPFFLAVGGLEITNYTQKIAFHLLKYFIHWIQTEPEQPKLTETHARWMFSLLTRIGDFVSSDDMNLLRNFVRACISLLGALVQKRVSSGGPEEYEKLCFSETSATISEQSCWMIISIAIRVWAQLDLWDDVETTLRDISLQQPPDPATPIESSVDSEPT